MIQAMQLGRWASHTPQKTTTAARRARAAMAAGCCALAFGRRTADRTGFFRGALPTERVRGGKPVVLSGWGAATSLYQKILYLGFDYRPRSCAKCVAPPEDAPVVREVMAA